MVPSRQLGVIYGKQEILNLMAREHLELNTDEVTNRTRLSEAIPFARLQPGLRAVIYMILESVTPKELARQSGESRWDFREEFRGKWPEMT